MEITSEMGSVGISDELQGKYAYLVQVNKSDAIISGDVSSFIETDFSRFLVPEQKFRKVPYIPPKTGLVGNIVSARSVSDSSETEYSVGDTKNFYAFDDKDNVNTTYAAGAVLKKVGDYCYIWYKEKNGISLEDSVFDTIAEKFDSIYLKETYIFGSNVPEVSYNNIISVTDSTKIHILIYDLFDDSDETAESKSGTYGYFSSSDMITNALGSNKLEMINIDSYFLQEDQEGIISTLAHEFQHMLCFVQKSLNVNDQDASTWFYEMMAMVCEDIMQTQLGISDKAAPCSRLYQFNYSYFLGFTTWGTGETVYASYANAYAFGAYLLRNFGIDFIRELAHNKYVDKEAVTKALETTGASLSSFDEALEQFYNVLIFPEASTGLTLNKSAEKTYTIDGSDVTFKCSAINLNKYYVELSEELAGYYYAAQTGYHYGPCILKEECWVKSLYPTGIQINYLGKKLDSLDVSVFSDEERSVFLVFKD